MYTPWGESDYVKDIGRGIIRADTPSHGGYWVPDHEAKAIPASYRARAERSNGGDWYEEDCEWASVAVTFPDLFPTEAVKQAITTIAWREEYARSDARRAAMLASGAAVRCSAMSVSGGRVHVLFKQGPGYVGRYMSGADYEKVPLMANATPEDYAAAGAVLTEAPGDYVR